MFDQPKPELLAYNIFMEFKSILLEIVPSLKHLSLLNSDPPKGLEIRGEAGDRLPNGIVIKDWERLSTIIKG